MTYKKINHVLTYIPQSFQRELNDTEQWLSWALQYLRTVSQEQRFVKELVCLPFTNHRLELPKGLKKITDIRLLTNDPTDEELEAISGCVAYDSYKQDAVDTDPTFSDTGCAVYHQMFLDSSYYNNCWKPMRYHGIAGKNYFSSSCLKVIKSSNCSVGFSLGVDCCLLIDEKDGYVCIEYLTEPKDSKGNFIVPEHPTHLWKALAHYGISQYFLNKSAFEARYYNLYEAEMMKARSYMREAKGIYKQQNLSFSMQSEIIAGDQRIIRVPAVWANRI